MGAHINGLGIVRALAARGVRCAVIRTKPYDMAHRSRFALDSECAPALIDAPESLVEILERRVQDWRGWALLATNDEALYALSRWKDRLSASYRVLAPELPVVERLIDKERMVADALAVGLELPRQFGVASDANLARAHLQFPVVIKPFESHRFIDRFGLKVFLAKDLSELKQGMSEAVAAGLRCGVFEMIPGGDRQIYTYNLVMSKSGEPGPGVAVRKFRQSPPLFGVARAAEVVPEPKGLREGTVELLRHIGFRGAACAEFKLDPRDSAFKFLEVNGRPIIYNSLLRKSGLDLAASLWSEYMERRRLIAEPGIWPGAWVNFHADLLHSAIHGRSEGLNWREFAWPYRRPVIDAVWSAIDPLPSALQWGHTARRGVVELLSRKRGAGSMNGSRPLETSPRRLS